MSAATREKAIALLQSVDIAENPEQVHILTECAAVMALVTIADSLEEVADAISGLTTRMISVEVHDVENGI